MTEDEGRPSATDEGAAGSVETSPAHASPRRGATAENATGSIETSPARASPRRGATVEDAAGSIETSPARASPRGVVPEPRDDAPPLRELLLARFEAGTGDGEAALRHPHIGGTTAIKSKAKGSSRDGGYLSVPFWAGLGGKEKGPCREGRWGHFLSPFTADVRDAVLSKTSHRVCLRGLSSAKTAWAAGNGSE